MLVFEKGGKPGLEAGEKTLTARKVTGNNCACGIADAFPVRFIWGINKVVF